LPVANDPSYVASIALQQDLFEFNRNGFNAAFTGSTLGKLSSYKSYLNDAQNRIKNYEFCYGQCSMVIFSIYESYGSIFYSKLSKNFYRLTTGACSDAMTPNSTLWFFIFIFF
jgi:hypothetical protein